MSVEDEGKRWPEQDVIDAWWRQQGPELKDAVSAPRIDLQRKIDKLAKFTAHGFPLGGDPVDTAIIAICRLQRQVGFLRSCAMGGEEPTDKGMEGAAMFGDKDAEAWT